MGDYYSQFHEQRKESNQLSFDEQAAHEATEEAIQRVSDHGEPEGKARLLAAVRRVAVRQGFFTTDDVWALEPLPGVHEPRVLGAVMRTAAAKGWIEKTERYEKSKRRDAHSNPKRVWRSLVWFREI